MEEQKEGLISAGASHGSSNKLQQEEIIPRRLSCTKCFDELWFCYSPFHQMQHYYRYAEFDNCFGKWNALVDCLNLKRKKLYEVQEILESRDKAKLHIWSYRTVEEASKNWWNMHSHFFVLPPTRDD